MRIAFFPLVALVVAFPGLVGAQEAPGTPATPEAGVGAAEAPIAEVPSIARGLYVETLVGGGYAVVGSTIPADPTYPTLEGLDEGLGAGSIVRFDLGYDITPLFALEATGGMALISTRRRDRVRDLGVAFGGLAARFSFEMSERLMLRVSAGGGYGQADNSIEAPDSGPVAFGDLGIEYFVHVRHFSIGLDLSVLAPLSPTRVFVALAPQLKYTF